MFLLLKTIYLGKYYFQGPKIHKLYKDCFNLPIITCLHDNAKSLWACKLCSILFSFIVCLSSLHVTKYSKTYNIMKLRINSELNLPTEREPGGSISVDLTRAAGCIEESSWLDPG